MSWANYSAFAGGETELKIAERQLVYLKGTGDLWGEFSLFSKYTPLHREGPSIKFCFMFSTYSTLGTVRDIKIRKIQSSLKGLSIW